MNWIILTAAGLLEICWAISMKYSAGFTKLWPSLLTIVAMTGSVLGLAWAMRTLPMGTSYAVWTGIGTVGTAVIGMIFLGEAVSVWRVLCLAMIVGGIVGLRLVGLK